MDKTLQEKDEMQDEELYALLDRAFETERLCVSEDLIQKTLARVAEEEDTKVVPFEKAAKRRISPMKYVGVAAAAVLVVVVGVRTLGNGKVSMDAAPMEVKFDNAGAGYRAETDTTDGRGVAAADSRKNGTEYYYSLSDSDVAVEHEAADDMVTDTVAPETEASEAAPLEYRTLTVSDRLAEAFSAAGKVLLSREADCWELADGDAYWEDTVLRGLAAGETFSDMLAENGDYSYMLLCKDGSIKPIQSGQPLDFIVRLETEEGPFWCLLGGGADFRME